MLPAVTLLSLTLIASTGGGDGHSPTHVFRPAPALASWRAAVEGEPGRELGWLARGGEAVWWVDPEAKVVHRLAPAGEGSSALEQARAWPLPEGLRLAERPPGYAGLAPWAGGTWLVDGAQQLLWRLRGEAWEGPWPLPDRVASAVALGEREVVCNTPAHPLHPFAVVGEGGRVVRRFGARRRGAVAALDEAENSWRLAVSPRQERLLAAHAYWPLVAAWGRDGTPLWERTLPSPEARRLAGRQRELQAAVRREESSGCVVCELLHVSLGVEVDGRGEVWVHLGEAAALEWLASDGAWRETVPVEGRFAPLGGLALRGDRLFTWQRDGVHGFVLQVQRQLAVVRVENEAGQPVPGARVAVAVEAGPHWEMHSDAAGRATCPAPPEGSRVAITAAARGYRRERREGEAPGVFAQPLRLHAADEICVQVTVAGSRAPVRRFTLAADLLHEGVGPGGIEEGEGVEVEDEGGRGCVAVEFAYPVELRVAAEGYATWRRRIYAGPEGEVPVELERAAVLVVVVVDEQRRVVPQAGVVLASAAVAERTHRLLGSDFVSQTDERGEAVFPRLAPGRYQMSVKAEHFLPWEEGVELAAGRTDRRVTLQRGGRVAVTVISEPAKTPVAGAEVELWGLPDASRRPTCRTGGDGRCTLEGLPPGSFTVQARSGGRVPATRRVHLRQGESAAQVEIPLRRGVRVEGRVRGVEEYPEVAFRVRASAPRIAPLEGPVSEAGVFALEDVPSGRVQLWVWDPATNGTYAHRVVELPEEQETAEVTLELPRPLRLEGQVRTGEHPCRSCRAELTLRGAEVLPAKVVRLTDEAGRFLARLPRPGAWQVRIFSAAGELGVDEVLTLSMDEARAFEMGRASVAGRVVREDGSPVPGAWVRVLRQAGLKPLRAAAADVGGKFHFLGLPAGGVRIVAAHEGVGGEVALQLETGQEEQVELVLRGEILRLRLRNAVTGAPITGATAFGVQEGSGYTVFQQASDPRGVFHLPVAGERVVALVVGVVSHALTTVRGPFLGGEPREVLVFPYHRSLTLEVRPDAPPICSLTLMDGSGQALALSLEWAPGPVPLHSRSALFNFLPPGELALAVTPCRGAPLVRPLPYPEPWHLHLVVP